MNTGNDIHEHGDRALQQLQRQAVAALSSQTLAQLRQRRPRASDAGAQRSRHRRWWLASACSALLAIAAALNFNTLMPAHPPVGGDRASLAIAGDDEALLLDENPELYLWLGSETTLAME